MQNISTYLLWPVIAGIIILLFEYFVIQPFRKANEVSIPSSVGKDWTTAIKIAVKKFKAQQSGYNWFWLSSNRNSITLDEWDIQKGQATILLSVYQRVETWEIPVPGVLQPVTMPRVIAQYQLLIDRTGDIRKLSSVRLTSNNQVDYPKQSTKDLPPTSLVVKNKSVKTEKVSNSGIKVLIEFDVVNSGKAGKVCPYMEYKVITYSQDSRSVWSEPKSYDINALGTIQFKYENIYYPPDIPLVDSIDKIKVELYPCPNS